MSISVPSVIAARDKICAGLVDHVGTQPIGAEFDRFVEDLTGLLPANISQAIVYESLAHLLGQELLPALIRENAWRLAGNIQKLKEAQVIYPWQGQGEPEWVPVQVMEADYTKTWKGESAFQYKLKILAGSSCPLFTFKTWTIKACSYIARSIGFSAPWKEFAFHDGHELVSMRFLAEIEAKYCKDNRPGFEKINCPDSLERWNKEILKARAHIEPPCPYGFTHYCFKCPVGYDQCKAGVHPKTYELKMCSICDDETNHDPGRGMTCVQCKDKSRNQR